MSVLSKTTLEKLILEKNLVDNYKSLEEQLTPNGMDFRLGAVIEVEKSGTITISKDKAVKPSFGIAWVLKGYEHVVDGLDLRALIVVEEGDAIKLEKNQPYLVISCESVNTPEDIQFKLEIRSSLFRYGNCILETGFGEAGYKGRMTCLMYSLLGTEIDAGVRFCQLAFYKLDGKEHYEKQKHTNYQGGKIV